MREDIFRVQGVVLQVVTAVTFCVQLPNGHQLLAFATKRTALLFSGLKVGDLVKLQITPFDLSTGRLIV